MRILGAWEPDALLVVGDLPEAGAATAGRVVRVGAEAGTDALEGLGRFDAAAVTLPADVPAGTLELLLGRLKNLHAPRILVTLAGEPPASRLRALAFEPTGEDGTVWVHDIDRYNRQRDWNSPENWAHPENFDKYRW